MPMSRSVALVPLLALAAALGLRWVALDSRPMHNDEAVNAIKFGQLWDSGRYRYDPNEHHGPTLYYATLAMGRISRGPDFNHYTAERLRWVTILFGLGLILLLPFLLDGLGPSSVGWAAVFTAVSPAFVFYSRYYIHEMLLVFFTFLALVAGWRYWRSRSLVWMLIAGAALGLMSATKETFVITLGAAAVAVTLNQTWNRLIDASGRPVTAPRLNPWHVVTGLALWLGVAMLFFSSFFTNAAGPLDALRTYQPWFQRAAGDSPHIHPWSFYLHRLLFFHAAKGPVWTEALVLVLACVAALAGFRRRNLANANASFIRFLALYTFILGAFYSLLPYKTPWCLLSFWHGAILLAGVGAAGLVCSLPSVGAKVGIGALLVLGAGHMAWQSWQQDTTYAADPRNPYVYAQTSTDLLSLVRRVDALAQADSQGQRMLIKVMVPGGDYWPLPWYLRSFDQVGWWDRVPDDPFAPVMIVSPHFDGQLDQNKAYIMTGIFQLRPQVFLELFVQKELWQDWLAHRRPEKD